MGLEDLLSPQGVIHNLRAKCKREALQALAERASGLIDRRPASDILSTLLEREQLGSTGVGDGVALPHGKMDGLSKIVGVLARLETPVSFDALDDQPVDLVFMLLAPANATAAHLKALAKVSRLFRDEDARDALRGADSAEALFAIATADQKHHAA
jgi:PTS system nitrogen regulatory IIA component